MNMASGRRWQSILLCLVLFGNHHTSSSSVHKRVAQQQLLDELFANYDKRIRPHPTPDEPLVVEVDMFVNSLTSVNELKMEYGMQTYMRQRWKDPRLKFPANFQYHNDSILFHYDSIELLWLPDLFISNSKEEERHDVSTLNAAVWLSSDGSVFYSQRLSLTMACNMDFRLFPGDNQTCAIWVESYSRRTTDLIFKWYEPGVEFNRNITLPEFELDMDNVRLEDCTKEFTTGVYTCISVKFSLTRNVGYYMTQVYIPSILIVILSWLSFFIDVQAAPARVSIGLLTVLTITTQTAGVRSQLPRVAYTKAIDVWMAVCLGFVAMAFFEYTLAVNTKKRGGKNAKTQNINSNGNGMTKVRGTENPNFKDDSHEIVNASQIGLQMFKNFGSNGSKIQSGMSVQGTYGVDRPSNGNDNGVWARKQHHRTRLCQGMFSHFLRNIDNYSIFIFPASFVLFNVIYWVVYFT